MSPRTAVLLLDLQIDFLDPLRGRMPVLQPAATDIIQAANEILARQAAACALPVLVVNAFPASDRVANFFRRQAAVAGSPGAALDPRIHAPADVRIFPKSRSSAFTNPQLEPYLRKNSITDLVVLGVFAEGCIRATAIDARRRGFKVVVPQREIGTNARWKKAFALWALRRGGVTIVPSVPASWPLMDAHADSAAEAVDLPRQRRT